MRHVLLLVLAISIGAGCSQSRLPNPDEGSGSGDVGDIDRAAESLIFDRGVARRGDLPATTDASFGLGGDRAELTLGQGVSARFDFAIEGDADDVVATLLQVEGASSHIEIPLDGARRGHVVLSLREALCRQLCPKRLELSVLQTFKTRRGSIGRHVRALRIVLDCGGRGDRCDEPAGMAGLGGMGHAGMNGQAGHSGMSGHAGVGGQAGMSAGAGGVGGEAMCTNSGEVDITCPDAVGPFEGSCAPSGECCHRASNSAKIEALEPSEPQTLEYRISQLRAINHPLSISLPIIQMSAAERARTCAGDQCGLLRVTQPREGGAPIAGPGSVQQGVGRYNCDGTYSFYGTSVAPPRADVGFTSPSRWAALAGDATIDPSLDGAARTRTTWATNPSQRVTCAPYLLPGTQTIDWEQCTTGYEILALDTSNSGLDCQGQWDGSSWQATGLVQSFVPLVVNNTDTIDSLGQNLCQLLSFSVLMPEDRATDCLAIPRCVPGTEGCKYVKLPDSLCPDTDEERGLFRCHLGAIGNPNDEVGYPSDLNCTATAPTTALDPDVDPSVSAGQCCDPLGANTGGLPACNAFRIVSELAAGAAEITDAPSNELAPVCF